MLYLFTGELETPGKCGLLQQDTEVIISPKSRYGPKLPQNLQPSKPSASRAEEKPRQVGRFLVLKKICKRMHLLAFIYTSTYLNCGCKCNTN